MRLLIPPPLVFASFLAFIYGLGLLLPEWHVELPGKLYASLLLVGIAALFSAPSIVSFRRADTTLDPRNPERSSSLVVSGMYRYSRNPMYLGLLLLVSAFAVQQAHLPALLLMPLGFFLYMTRFQIEPEESALEQLYGAEYLDYRMHVRRWI